MSISNRMRYIIASAITALVLLASMVLIPQVQAPKAVPEQGQLSYQSWFGTPGSEPPTKDPAFKNRAIHELLTDFLAKPQDLASLHSAWVQVRAQEDLLADPGLATLVLESARLSVDLGYLVPAKTFCTLLADRGDHEAAAWLGTISCKEADLAQNPLDKIDLVQKGLEMMAAQVHMAPDSLPVHLIYLLTMLNLPEFFDCHQAILEELSWLVESNSWNMVEENTKHRIMGLLGGFKDWTQEHRPTLAPLLAQLRSNHAN